MTSFAMSAQDRIDLNSMIPKTGPRRSFGSELYVVTLIPQSEILLSQGSIDNAVNSEHGKTPLTDYFNRLKISTNGAYQKIKEYLPWNYYKRQ